jgi:hypothetical protein
MASGRRSNRETSGRGSEERTSQSDRGGPSGSEEDAGAARGAPAARRPGPTSLEGPDFAGGDTRDSTRGSRSRSGEPSPDAEEWDGAATSDLGTVREGEEAFAASRNSGSSGPDSPSGNPLFCRRCFTRSRTSSCHVLSLERSLSLRRTAGTRGSFRERAGGVTASMSGARAPSTTGARRARQEGHRSVRAAKLSPQEGQITVHLPDRRGLPTRSANARRPGKRDPPLGWSRGESGRLPRHRSH